MKRKVRHVIWLPWYPRNMSDSLGSQPMVRFIDGTSLSGFSAISTNTCTLYTVQQGQTLSSSEISSPRTSKPKIFHMRKFAFLTIWCVANSHVDSNKSYIKRTRLEGTCTAPTTPRCMKSCVFAHMNWKSTVGSQGIDWFGEPSPGPGEGYVWWIVSNDFLPSKCQEGNHNYNKCVQQHVNLNSEHFVVIYDPVSIIRNTNIQDKLKRWCW